MWEKMSCNSYFIACLVRRNGCSNTLDIVELQYYDVYNWVVIVGI